MLLLSGMILVAAVWAACFRFPLVWVATGIGEGDRPFLDLRNLLAAGEAAQAGHNPYVHNPTDPYHRPLVYTEWWLAGGALGLTLADTLWLGTLLAAATLLAAGLLTRPANRREAAGFVLFLVSPALLMAIVRANNDLVVFVLMSAALGCLRLERTAGRALGIVMLAAAAALKYFPLAAVILLLGARTRRELLGWLALYGLVLLMAGPSLEPGLRAAAQGMAPTAWLYAFGAPVIFRDFELAVPAGWTVALFVTVVIAAFFAIKSPPAAAAHDAEREFTCGAAMVAGCFLHGSSYVYKLIFAAWFLPWLWRAPAAGKSRAILTALLFTVVWLEGIMAAFINLGVTFSLCSAATGQRALEATLLVSQLATWALAVALGRRLLIYVHRELRRLCLLPV